MLEGRKKVELRRWTTRYRGWVWLHTGQSPDVGAANYFRLSNLFLGGFVGAFRLLDVVSLDPDRWEAWRSRHLDIGPFQPAFVGWVIQSAVRLTQPYRAPGNVNLFNLDRQRLADLLTGTFVGEIKQTE